MNSQGIGADIRRVLLRGNVFALAIAVLIGTALFRLLYAIVEYVAIPFAGGTLFERTEGGFSPQPLYSYFHGYLVVWGEALSLAITLSLAALLVLFLRRRLVFNDGDEDEPELEEESDFRACPECLSLIPSAARRCSYCTAPVAPSVPERQE